MRFVVASVCWGLVATLPLCGAEVVIDGHRHEFAGETYTCRFVAGNDQEKLAEFTREGETLADWSRLIAVRHYPQATGTPTEAAAQVARVLRQVNPLAKFQLLSKEDGSEALLDFITWPQHAEYAEFNAFRYIRLPNEPGLISYQFAYRFTDSSPSGTQRFIRAREAWLDELLGVRWPVLFGAK